MKLSKYLKLNFASKLIISPIFQFFNLLIFQFSIAQNSLDELNYHYTSNTNQLNYISDNSSSATSSVDLDNQSTNNYEYNLNGQLSKDVSEGILEIEWNLHGQIKNISLDDNSDAVADRIVEFTYDALGNRVKKIETIGTTVNTTYYIRNAKGKLISIYEDSGSGAEREEVHNAVGIDKIETTSSSSNIYIREIGFKNYEIKDHLGSIRTNVTDIKKVGSVTTPYLPDINFAADYYSYGMLMPGRDDDFISYRKGYQQIEKDDEIKGSGNSYNFGARMLDPRIGQWLSPDPLESNYPSVSPYISMNNNPILNTDPDGKAWTVSQQTDSSGNVHYSMQATMALYNNSNDIQDIQAYRAEMERQVEAQFTGNETRDGHTVSWSMDASIRVVDDLDDVDYANKEHLIIIEDETNFNMEGSMGGVAISDLVIIINSKQNMQWITRDVLPHELGHTGGLYHTDGGVFPQWMTPSNQRSNVPNLMDYTVDAQEKALGWQIEIIYNNYIEDELNEYYWLGMAVPGWLMMDWSDPDNYHKPSAAPYERVCKP